MKGFECCFSFQQTTNLQKAISEIKESTTKEIFFGQSQNIEKKNITITLEFKYRHTFKAINKYKISVLTIQLWHRNVMNTTETAYTGITQLLQLASLKKKTKDSLRYSMCSVAEHCHKVQKKIFWKCMLYTLLTFWGNYANENIDTFLSVLPLWTEILEIEKKRKKKRYFSIYVTVASIKHKNKIYTKILWYCFSKFPLWSCKEYSELHNTHQQ